MSRRPERGAVRRRAATPPADQPGLCLVRFGRIGTGWSGRAAARRLARDLDAALPSLRNAGLHHAERLDAGRGHLAWLLYWRDLDAVEAWARAATHTTWWRAALDRMHRRGDLGVYHEAYVVPRAGIESIDVDSPPVGLLAFGQVSEPSGHLTTARGRIGST